MEFDINKHIKDHAYLYKQFNAYKSTDLHFKFSILDLYFLANKHLNIEEKMKEILDELLKPTTYTIKMKNGYYIDKNNNKKQKYANRNIKIDLKKHLTAIAIHTKGSKGEYTQPHIHFLFKKNSRLGINYSLLKYHISKTLEKHGLIAHFDELDDYKYKNLAKNVSKFFWQLKKLSDKEFEKYIAKNSLILKKYLDLLYNYAKSSNRLDYFFKTMQILRKRLNKLNIDFQYNGHNLRYSYDINFVLENKENKAVIDILQNKKYSQKDIKAYLDNAILRDAVRYCNLKEGAYIINEIKHNTTLLDNFKTNKTLTNNYLKLLKRELQTTKTKTQLKEEGKLEYINAFKNALKIAKNEKELREILKEKYDFKFKKRQGKTIGFKFNNTYLSIKDLGYNNISEIRQVLISNNIQNTKNRSEPLKITYKSEKNKRNLEKRRKYYEIGNYSRIAELIATARENAITIKANTERELSIKTAITTDTRREYKIKENIRELATREFRDKRGIKENIRNNKRGFQIYKTIRIYAKLAKSIQNSITEFKDDIQKRIGIFGKRISSSTKEIRRGIKELKTTIRIRLKELKIKKLVEKNFESLQYAFSEQFYRYCERNNPEYEDFDKFFKNWIVEQVLKNNINLEELINAKTITSGFKIKR